MIHTKAIFIFNFLIFTIVSFSQSTTQWKLIHPGIWNLTVGKPEKISLLKAAGIQPDEKGLSTLPVSSFPMDKKEIVVPTRRYKTILSIIWED